MTDSEPESTPTLRDLVRVEIRTDASGPWGEDFVWVLTHAGGQVYEIGLDAAQGNGLLQLLQTLPGFDNQAVIDASLSVEEGTFLCWQQPIG